MTRYTKAALDELMIRYDRLGSQIAKLTKEQKQLKDEMMKGRDLNVAYRGNDWYFKVTTRRNWQSFDSTKAAVDYPVDEFPEVYAPTYGKLKELLAEAKKESEIDNYCGQSTFLTVGRIDYA